MRRLEKWLAKNWLVVPVGLVYAWLAVTRPATAARALKLAATTFIDTLPTLIAVFVLVGLLAVWVEQRFVVKHLGEGSGLKGIAIGAGLGTVLHGPLVGVFPLLEGLLRKGARPAVAIAIVSTWAIKLPMIPLELQLFGWKFTIVREGLLFASAFVLAPLIELAIGKHWIERFREPAEEGAL
ncbi:MAG: permease [Actinomycetia bacterium]|nr:permease [Actinomycetes bacterium]